MTLTGWSGVSSYFSLKMKGNVSMQFVWLLRGKLVVVALVSVAIVRGATAAFAATPVGQGLVHSILA
jgi:uncharacterized protein (DUF427 family)